MYKIIIVLSLLLAGTIAVTDTINCSTTDTEIPSLSQLAAHASIALLKTPSGFAHMSQAQLPPAVQSILENILRTTHFAPLAAVTCHARATILKHKGPVLSVAWGPQGDKIATTVSGNKDIMLWTQQSDGSLASSRLKTGHKVSAQQVAWSCNDQIAVSSWEGTINILSPDLTGSHTHVKSFCKTVPENQYAGISVDQPIAMNSLGWSHDGNKLAIAVQHTLKVSSAYVFNYHNGTNTVSCPHLPHYALKINSVTLHPQSNKFAIASSGLPVTIYDQNEEGYSGSALDQTRQAHCAAWSADGNQLMAGLEDGTISICRENKDDTKYSVHKNKCHTAAVHALASRPSNVQFVSAGKDKLTLLWDKRADGTHIAIPLIGHTDCVNALAWKPDGSQLATASQDGTVRLSPMPENLPYEHMLAAFGVFHAKQNDNPEYTDIIRNYLSIAFANDPENPLVKSLAKQLVPDEMSSEIKGYMCSVQ